MSRRKPRTLTAPERATLLGLNPRLDPEPLPPDTCRVCGERVHLMIYRGTRFCSQRCELADR